MRAAVRLRKRDRRKNFRQFRDRLRSDIRDGEVRGLDPEIQGFRLEATSIAGRAGLIAPVATEKHADVHFVSL